MQQDQDENQPEPAVSLRALGLGPADGVEPAVRAFRTVLALAHVLRSRMDARLRTDDLTTMQAAALTAIDRLGAPTAADLAAALGTTRQNVAQLVAALRRKAMIAVRPDAVDRRARRLTVTEAARSYWAARDDGDLVALRDWFAALTDQELATLTDLATRVLAPPGPTQP